MEFPWRCNVDTIAMDLKVSWEMSDQLGSGDKHRINFRGEHYSDLSGDYEIVGDGIAALPLVGNIYLGGKTVSEAAKTIKSAYKPGYIKDPEINVQVLNYRPFYIWGQVDSPGKYPHINGMTVLEAVVIAGGFIGLASGSNLTLDALV